MRAYTAGKIYPASALKNQARAEPTLKVDEAVIFFRDHEVARQVFRARRP